MRGDGRRMSDARGARDQSARGAGLRRRDLRARFSRWTYSFAETLERRRQLQRRSQS